MKLKIAQFINIMLIALVVGVFWGTWFSLSRSMASLSPEVFLANGKAFIQNLAVLMSILMPLTLLSTLPVLLWLPEKRASAFYLTLTSLVFMIVATLVTVLVEVPIDNQIMIWTPTTLPSSWEAIPDRWEFYHTVRTFVSLAGLGSALAGALLASHQKAGD